MKNKVYCTNNECRHYRVLDVPIHFTYSKYAHPLSNDLVRGYCSITPKISRIIYSTKDITLPQSVCSQCEGGCGNFECLHNNEGACSRDEILIDKGLISKNIICKCFSNRGISGHQDWSRFANPDKGGLF